MAKKKSSEDKGAKQPPTAEQTAKAQEQKKQTVTAGKKKDTPDKGDEETTKTSSKSKKKQAQSPVPPIESVAVPMMSGFLTVRLPKTLRTTLEKKMLEEEVSLDELVTYLLMRGLSVK